MKTKIGIILLTGLMLGCFLLACPLNSEAQLAPVTTAAKVYAVPGQQVVVPVTVSGFNNIGSVTLSMDYDYAKLHFISADLNPALIGNFSVGDNNMGNGIHRLVLGWFGDGASLPDGSFLINYTFTYISGTAPLQWFEMGPSCEYTDANAIIQYDMPTTQFYINGLVDALVDKQLQLSIFIEGLYNSATHKMNFARNAVTNQFPGTTVDQVTIELHDASNYANIVYTAENVNLTESGNASVTIPYIHNGSYYISIKHRNSVETVSALPVSFAAGTINYSFDAPAKTYGSNLKQQPDGAWVIVSGDVNQDGCVDAADMIPVDNDAASFSIGYIASDLDGNGLVNDADISIAGINAAGFVKAVTP